MKGATRGEEWDVDIREREGVSGNIFGMWQNYANWIEPIERDLQGLNDDNSRMVKKHSEDF